MSYADVAASGLEDTPVEIKIAADKAIQEAEEKNAKELEEAELQEREEELKKRARKVVAEGEELVDDLKHKASDKAKELKKELNHLGEEGQSLLNQFVASVKASAAKFSSAASEYSACAQTQGKKVASRTATELQNPVVATQVVVGLTGAIAGYLAYLERGRIQSANKYVLGIHAGVITGLILADGFLFARFYDKYDKK